jgi:hypothetical protein
MYAVLNMVPNPAFQLRNGNPHPIKITLLNAANVVIGTPILRGITADAFTAAELAAIKMPTVTNATSLLAGGDVSNPTLSYDAGSALMTSLQLMSTPLNSVTGNTVAKIILARGQGSQQFSPISLLTTDTYKSIYAASRIPGRGGMIVTKYFWAPTCPSLCY